METKYSKVFAKKLLAIFLSVLMALTSFTGALSAYAASVQTDKDYHDNNLASNFMAWAETTDEQTCEALLDWADMHLDDLMTDLLGDSHIKFYQNAVVLTIDIDGYLDSVDGIFNLLNQVDSLLTGTLKTLAGGDIKNINLDPVGSDLKPVKDSTKTMSRCGYSYRSQYSAKELILALARFLEVNSNDVDGKNVIGNFVKGNLNLGSIITGILKDDVYGLLQGTLGMWDGYEYNLVYNIVANLILENTKWFSDAELSAYKADIRATSLNNRTFAFKFDDVLISALNDKLLGEIHAEITYPNYVENEDGNLINDSSVQRYKRIVAAMGTDKLDATVDQTSAAFKAAAQADATAHNYTYNPSLVYYTNNTKDKSATADMDLDTGCIFLFQTRNNDGSIKKINFQKTDNLYALAFQALEFAWTTALQDTLGLVHVNYDVDRGNGANFDNQYFYWVQANGTWDYDNWKSNYSKAQVEAWAADVAEEYNCASADKFLANVAHTYEYDRSVVEDAQGNWHDIDPTTLFNKLRYNPLADLYFDMQTGPINLYFEQTGIDPVSTFFETAFTSYDNMVAGLNDALVSATEIIFLDSDNIGYQSTDEVDNRQPVAPLTVPTMAKTGNTTNNATIANTLISNVVAMFEYAANAADANILNPYYTKHSITTTSGNLSEGVFEEAMIPLLVACLQRVEMTDPIHDEKWDSCKDAEGVAIVALEEYLSYVLPDKDYTVLWTYDADGYIVANGGQTLFDNAIMPMCRDALGYIISSVVPCRTADGNEWNVYDSDPTDSTTIFEILNSVMCYYASQDNFSDGTSGKAVATLLGVVNSSNQPLVTMSNDIWTNLDVIINTLLPAIGTAQYGTVATYGRANSYDLIYNDLIKGILDIGDPCHNGDMGVTNLLKRLITIITSSPVSANKATPHDTGSNLVEMVYNLVADVVNNLLGSRTDTRYSNVIPYAEYYDTDAYSDTHTATPFDSLVATSTLGHFSNGDGKDSGVLSALIYNIFKAFGGTSTTTGNNKTTGTKGCWIGAMFAVEAVNNFIPDFVPSIGDHTLNNATATVRDAAQSGLVAGNAFTTTELDITNNSIGLNRFYRDASGNVVRRPRYFVKVNSITQSSDTGATVTIGSYDSIIAPENTLRVSISGKAPSSPTTITFKVNYSIFKGEMNGTTKPTYPGSGVVFEDLEATAYMYLTNAVDWETALYDGSGHYNSGYAYTGTKAKNKSNAYTHTSYEYGGGSKYLLPTFPNDFIIKKSNAQAIDNKCFYVINCSNSLFGSDKSFDGLYATLMEGDQYYAVSGTTIADTITTAPASSDSNERAKKISTKLVGYAAIDRQTGDLVNYDRYDISVDGGETWNLGPVIYDDFTCGYDASELSTMQSQGSIDNSSISATFAAQVKAAAENGTLGTRVHHAWTLQQAMAHGLVKGVMRQKSKVIDGVQTYLYDYVLIDLNSSYAKTKMNAGSGEETVGTKMIKGGYEAISWGTKTPGIYFQTAKTKVAKAGDAWLPMMKYDGSTELDVQDYDMGVFLYTTENQNMYGKIHMYVADDTASTDLKKAYNEALGIYSTYADEDMKEGKVDKRTDLADALKKAVATVATPISATNAGNLGSVMEAVPATNTAYDTIGDKAYMPIPVTTAIDANIQANATKGDDYWYYNKEMTIPVCSNTPVTTAAQARTLATITGKSIEADEEGVYRYVNEAQYETEWDTTSYETPYRKTTSTQATDNAGMALYNRISFTCYDENGAAMDSRGAWTYIIADQYDAIKENDGNDYRGVYQRDVDNLQYYIEQMKENVNADAASRIVDEVMKDREGLNSVNYEVASYEKMVQIAKDAEDLVWSEAVGEPTYYATNAEGERVSVHLSNQSTAINTLYEDADGNLYKNEVVETEQEYEYKTDKSMTQINAAIAMYEEFKGYVQDRGYIGDKLEAEINCATGYAYTALDFTKDTEPAEDDDADPIVTDATITSSTATEAKYGTWENGTLVNKKADGTQAYTDDSWKAYVIALANGIEIADAQEAKVSDTYTAKTDIQRAENNLEEYVEEPSDDVITVTGKIVIAADETGAATNFGIVGIDVMVDGEVVATSAADGTFTAEVPAGTTELVLDGVSAIARTVTLKGDANVSDVVIPVVICDYNHDKAINPTDVSLFSGYLSEYNVYADLNADSQVNPTDISLFSGFIGKTVVYTDLALD